jgi:hypothetical protein
LLYIRFFIVFHAKYENNEGTKMMEELTSINIKRGTLERLKALCSRALSYDSFLNECLDLYEKQLEVNTNE